MFKHIQVSLHPGPSEKPHVLKKHCLYLQVVVLQEYHNTSSSTLEAKYVFPLDDMAAVCGFEAFINGKHIVGEVKEKETAHNHIPVASH
jgi:poly [ADP-ribose] polymerase